MSDFYRALQITLGYEGGFTVDQGGPTQWGITQVTYDRYRQSIGLNTQGVRNITSNEMQSIYESLYWRRIRGNEVAWPLNLALFDLAVNSGPMRAVQFVQILVGVEADGQFGPITLKAVKSHDPYGLALRLQDMRAGWFVGLSMQAVHSKSLKGWLKNRYADLRKRILG